MDPHPHVVVVSEFGRGHWLAAELQTIGLEVSLVDVAGGSGNWSPEDIEGPFGFFQSEFLLQTQLARLDTADYAEAVDEGFTVWLKSGPVDFRSPLSQYLLEKKEVPADVRNYLASFDERTEKERVELRKSITKLGFHQNWLAHLAHSFASPIYQDASESLQHGRPLPLFAPYGLRRVSRRGSENSLEWVKSKNIKVYQNSKIEKFEPGDSTKIQIQSQGHRVSLQAAQVVWGLGRSTTEVQSDEAFVQLYNSQKLDFEMVWVRYRVEVQISRLYDSLPKQFLMIEELALPWTHANFMSVNKTLDGTGFDVWMRIPSVHRFQKSYLEQMNEEMLNFFKTRMPSDEFKLADFPREYTYDAATLGPARFGQFNKSQLNKVASRGSHNVHFDGPEQWPNLDWTGQFLHQREVFLALRAWKNEYDIKYEKLKAKEAAMLERERMRKTKE